MTYTQDELKAMYERQQTPEGQKQIEMQLAYIQQVNRIQITNRPMFIEVVDCLKNEKTGEIKHYFVRQQQQILKKG